MRSMFSFMLASVDTVRQGNKMKKKFDVRKILFWKFNSAATPIKSFWVSFRFSRSEVENEILEWNVDQAQIQRLRNGERPGALWHLFRSDDAKKIREYIGRVSFFLFSKLLHDIHMSQPSVSCHQEWNPCLGVLRCACRKEMSFFLRFDVRRKKIFYFSVSQRNIDGLQAPTPFTIKALTSKKKIW